MRYIILLSLLILLIPGCADKPEMQPRKVKKAPPPYVPPKIDSALWAHFRKIPSNPLVISEDQLDFLVPEIVIEYSLDYDNEKGYPYKTMNILGFELADVQAERTVYDYGVNKLETVIDYSHPFQWGIYKAVQKCRMPGDSALLVLFRHAFGWESSPSVFALFEKKDSNLIFKYFLNGFVDGGLDTLIQVNDNSYLMIGKSIYGDPGEEGETVWYAKWTKPDSFAEIYYKSYYAYLDSCEMKFERVLNTEKGIAGIKLLRRDAKEIIWGGTPEYGEWKIVEVDTLNYAVKFN